MLPKNYFGILVILHVRSAELIKGLKNCKEQTRSAFGYYLADFNSNVLQSCAMRNVVLIPAAM